MESFRLPCEHILAMLVKLNVSNLPNCLILKRWTKAAKDDIKGNTIYVSKFWDTQREARYLSLMEYYKHISVISSENFEKYNNKRVKAVHDLKEL